MLSFLLSIATLLVLDTSPSSPFTSALARPFPCVRSAPRTVLCCHIETSSTTRVLSPSYIIKLRTLGLVFCSLQVKFCLPFYTVNLYTLHPSAYRRRLNLTTPNSTLLFFTLVHPHRHRNWVTQSPTASGTLRSLLPEPSLQSLQPAQEPRLSSPVRHQSISFQRTLHSLRLRL